VLALACASLFGCTEQPGARGSEDAGGDEAPLSTVEPQGLDVIAHPGGCGALRVTALTLRGGELYVALRNDGAMLACSPAFSAQLFDRQGESLTTALGGLLVRRFYRLADGSDGIAACVSPGDTTMVAITDLPLEILPADVKRVEYWCNYWALAAEPIGEIVASNVRLVSGSRFAGALVNRLTVPLSAPAVAVFSLNGAGRPLEVSLAQAAVDVAPGGSWEFETSAVRHVGVDQAAYPSHGP